MTAIQLITLQEDQNPRLDISLGGGHDKRYTLLNTDMTSEEILVLGDIISLIHDSDIVFEDLESFNVGVDIYVDKKVTFGVQRILKKDMSQENKDKLESFINILINHAK